MELESENPLDTFYRFILIRFMNEAAVDLRDFINMFTEKLSDVITRESLIQKQLEALLVLISKTIALRRNHKNIILNDVKTAIDFFKFYTSTRNWINIGEKEIDIFKNDSLDLMEELKLIRKLELYPKSNLVLNELLSRFDKYVSQIFRDHKNLVIDLRKEKLLLLIKNVIIMISKLITLAKQEDKISSTTIIESYNKTRNLLFRLPLNEFDIIFNFKSFIKRELILRIAEFIDYFEKNNELYRYVEDYSKKVFENKIGNQDKLAIVNEFKNAAQLFYILKSYKKSDTTLSKEKFKELIEEFNKLLINTTLDNHEIEFKSIYNDFLKTNISIDGKIALSELRNRMVEFGNQVIINDNTKYLISELARKMSNLISFISRIIAIKNKNFDYGLAEIKQSLNILSMIYFNQKYF